MIMEKHFALLSRALGFVRQELHPDVTAQRLRILLAVAADPGLSQRELAATLGDTSVTALSRNLADLAKLTSRKTAGPGLIELRIDPSNLRLRRVHLTRAGERFMRRWSAHIKSA